jgi:hypothetical protein
MRRPRMDVAVHAQLDRRTSLLRDVVRSGGKDRWSHLHSHGHHYATVLCAVRQGYLSFMCLGYEITDSGKQYLDEIDAEQLRQQ